VFLSYLGVFLGRVTSTVLSWRPVTIVGGMCYSIYLYHFLVIKAVMPKTLLAWSPA
jgi:peptidoglycan/LPS O-acetylase OafA/YrhL